MKYLVGLVLFLAGCSAQVSETSKILAKTDQHIGKLLVTVSLSWCNVVKHHNTYLALADCQDAVYDCIEVYRNTAPAYEQCLKAIK